MSNDTKAQVQAKKYPGPYLDGSKATGMEVAYIDLRVGPVSRLYSPQPSPTVINEVLAGNAPAFVLDAALANDSYVPSAQVVSVTAAYHAWQANKAATR